MARLEDLIASVPDAQVRDALSAEVKTLKSRTKFGLVYERHLPETLCLGVNGGLRVNDDVRLRGGPDENGGFRVQSINSSKATIIDGGGDAATVPISDLLVVRRIGDPIFPALTSLGAVARSKTRPYHAVISSENYHALQLLLNTYEGQVDCIYIDPPYNTGARDWKYNNHYVDSTDAWRHSKWLSFMEKRLRLARRLLKPDGVLIVTIDENEGYHLGMLLEELLPAYLRYQVTMVINPKGVSKANFARVEEYAIFCVPAGKEIITGEAVVLTSDNGDGEAGDGEWGLVRRRGSESRRSDRPSMFYPIYIDEQARTVVSVGDPIPLTAKPDFRVREGLRPVWPIDNKGQHRRWQLGAETMRVQLAEGKLALGRYNKKQDSWTVNLWRPKKTHKRLKTVWWEKRHDAGTHGTNVVDALLGKDRSFPFPKSLYAVRDTLAAVVAEKPDALILDFFAGSGTTLHATCLLNQEDAGNRRCILVTNNEVEDQQDKYLRKEGHLPGDPEYEIHGIFEAVTCPRVEAAITGKRPDGRIAEGKYIDGKPYSDGFDENCEFFRLDYINPDRVELGKAFDKLHPLFWMKAGARAPRPKTLPRKGGFAVVESGGYAVLFDERAIHELVVALNAARDMTHVFVCTDSEDAYAEICELLPASITSERLYGDYLAEFRRSVQLAS